MLDFRRLILLCLPSLLLATELELDTDPEPNTIEKDWKKVLVQSKNLDFSIDNRIDSRERTTSLLPEDAPYQNVTVQLGGTAFLVCEIPLSDRVGVNWHQISFIRRRDWHILSSGSQLYTNDERFGILHVSGSNTWTLQIKYVQERDSTIYECQVSTSTGIKSYFMNLLVVQPEAVILGSGELHVSTDMGSTINLVCIIEKSPQPPQYIYWQRNDQMVNYDDNRRDITIETKPGPRTISRLIIKQPQISDSGNYTCRASNTEPASIYVYVSRGDNTAAMSHRNSSTTTSTTATSSLAVVTIPSISNIFHCISVLISLTILFVNR